MGEIKEKFVDGEIVYLKKGLLGWTVVHPIKINGKTNWKNLIAGGSWIKLGILALIVILIVGSIYEYSAAVNVANECIARSNIPLF